MRLTFAPATLLALLACVAHAQQARERADLVLHHGKIVTVDDADRIVSALAIRDGKILAVGDESLVARYEATRVIDLGGRMAMPGFNDSHTHIAGMSRRDVDLSRVRSIQELQDSIAAKAKVLGPGQWIVGHAWTEDNLAEHRVPVRGDLDVAAPNNPVTLYRAGHHSSASNSAALRLAGITRDTPQPNAGMIEHDAAGEPTGVIRERYDLVDRVLPNVSPDELRPSFVAELQRQLSLGITSIVQAGANASGYDDSPDWPEWERVYREHRGELPRASVQIYWRSADDLRAFGKHPGDGDEWLRVGPLKLLVDGGFSGPSAYTRAPYKGSADFRGTLNYSPDSLYKVIRAAHALGWQMGFHAIGDSAIVLTVNTFDRVLRASPKADHRNYLNHFSMLPPVATLEMMARDSILVTQQPNFTYTVEGRYQQALEGERLAHNNPIASVTKRGVFMAFSSDILPIGPMVGLYAAVTRKGKTGTVYAADEAVPMSQGLRAYTRNGAYLTREERTKGTLEPEKLADVIVLSQDLLTIPPERILDTKVDLTILGGRVVYERNTSAVAPAVVQSPEVRSDGRVIFRVRAPNAREVRVAGDVGSLAMSRDAQGIWSTTTDPLAADLYQYRFLVDSVPYLDPSNALIKPNLLTPSSVVHVPGPASLPWEVGDVPRGIVHRHFYKSRVVGDERDYYVYTPAGYDPSASRRYPVLYLLHGFSDGADGWTSPIGRANVILDNLIAQGRAKPMLVVMPLGYGTPEMLASGPPGRPRPPGLRERNARKFGEMLLGEMIPAVEREYRVARDAGSRAIAGLSMGGFEALYVGLNNPDKFTWVGGFSSAMFDEAPASFPELRASTNAKVRLIWIACGIDDSLIGANRKFEEWLTTKHVRHTAVETPGVHNWLVWRRNLVAFAPLLFR